MGELKTDGAKLYPLSGHAPIPGQIHGELDHKLLLLYILRRLCGPVDREDLFEICICDNGVGYFDYSDYLEDLVNNGHVAVNEEGEYSITSKGRKNGSEVESRLPKSVRNAVDKAIIPANTMIKRGQLIKTERTDGDNGSFMHLSLSDGEIELMKLDIFCGDGERARTIKRNFRRNAEEIYKNILETLT